MKRAGFHPFLFSAYFVLALLGLNIDQVHLSAALRALFVVLAGTGLLLLLMYTRLKSWQRAALITSLALILFFTYGHVYHFLEGHEIFLGRHRLLLPLWIVLAGIGSWGILQRVRNLSEWTRLLNLISLTAMIFPVFQIARHEILLASGKGTSTVGATSITALRLPTGNPARDVYFIILDEYTRQDVLDTVFDQDNAAFLDGLRELGFTVVPCSQANYAQTELVLASTLNMDYLDRLGQFPADTTDRSALRRLIQDSLVERAFRRMGYSLMAFETGFPFSEFRDADIYLAPERESNLLTGMNNFEVLLLRSSAGLFLLDAAKVLPDFLVPDTGRPLEDKRHQVLYDLEMLARLPQEAPTPKFVFAHILLPHEPFVFDGRGEPVNYPEALDEKTYAVAYRDQVTFLNQRLLPILGTLIETSAVPPVIILQGDTGPGRVSHAERMAILSAYYLPEVDELLSTALSPVNNFRLVFNLYFSGQYDLLENRSYFSTYEHPYDFEFIPNSCVESGQ